jgi:hypothetical protein
MLGNLNNNNKTWLITLKKNSAWEGIEEYTETKRAEIMEKVTQESHNL